MTALRAKHLAIRALSDCFSSEQASGFESADNAGVAWAKVADINIHSATANGFIMCVDGHNIQISSKIIEPEGGAA